MKYLIKLMIAASAMALAGLVGCSPAAPVDTNATGKNVVLKAADEPEFEVAAIIPLARATENRTLPFVADESGAPLETPCLERSTKAKQWTTSNVKVQSALRDSKAQISQAVLAWIQEALADGNPIAGMGNWQVGLYEETVLIRHFATNDVRFNAEQTCITESIRTLPVDREVVTTLFGATGFSVVSPSPMDLDMVKAITKAGRKLRVQIKPVPTYPRARDENDKPISNNGIPLFEAPNGTLVRKKDVPRPKDRPVFELRFTVPRGLYLARGTMPASRFEFHAAPAGCTINLIFDDMTPRTVSCLGTTQMGFGVAMGENPDEVMVKAATLDDTGEKELPYDQVGLVQVGGTGFAWITPGRLEEGAVLTVDTLILHPRPATEEDLQKFKYQK